MGSGGPRDLEQARELPELDAELAKKLTVAVKRMDAIDAEFKEARHNERLSQLVKIWSATCKDIDRYLITMSDLLNETHQLNLEPRTAGGGRNITPWLEESGGRFEKMMVHLVDEQIVVKNGEEAVLAQCGLKDLSFEWMERVVVKWVIINVKAKL